MAIIDSQVHAYEANTPKRPWHSIPNWPDHVTGDEMVAAVDADRVHGRHHLVAGDVIGPVRDTVPGPFRGVGLVGVDLGIDDRHREAPPCQGITRSNRRRLGGSSSGYRAMIAAMAGS